MAVVTSSEEESESFAITVLQPSVAETFTSVGGDGDASIAAVASALVLVEPSSNTLNGSSGGLGVSGLVVTLAVSAQSPGACTSVEPGLFSTPASVAMNDSCVAGCCIDGVCACRLGFTGARCERELRCAIVPSGSETMDAGFSADGGGCHSEPDASGTSLVCSCSSLGIVAVVGFRMSPATNLGPHGMPPLDTLFAEAARMQLPIVAILIYALLLLLASALDARTLYVHVSHDALPDWLRPRPFTFGGEFLFNLRTRTTVLRVANVHNGHTVYTRAQLFHVLATTLMSSALSVSLFFGREGENCSLAAELVALAAIVFSSLTATLGRLAFKFARLYKGSIHRRIYYANKKARNDTKWGVGRLKLKEYGVMDLVKTPPDKSKAGTAITSVELGGLSAEYVSPHPPKMIGGAQKPDLSSSAADIGSVTGTMAARFLTQRGRSDSRFCQIWLPSSQWLFMGPDNASIGVKTVDPKSFVPAAHVAGNLFGAAVCVSYERTNLPTGMADLTLKRLQRSSATAANGAADSGDGKDGASTRPADGLSCCTSSFASHQEARPLIAAWAVNSLLFWGMFVVLLSVFRARRLMPQELQTSSLDEDDFHSSLVSGLVLSCAASFLLVDLVKAICLTLTATPALVAYGVQKKSRTWAVMNVVRKPFRRLHKILDVLL